MIKGKVEDFKQGKTSTGKDNFKFKILGVVYSGFGVPAVKNGDEIEFEFTQNEVLGANGTTIYRNVTPAGLKILSSATTPGEAIGESAKTKRRAEMMTCAKDIVIAAIGDEKIQGEIPNRISYVASQVKIVWHDLCKQIGEDPNAGQLQDK